MYEVTKGPFWAVIKPDGSLLCEVGSDESARIDAQRIAAALNALAPGGAVGTLVKSAYTEGRAMQRESPQSSHNDTWNFSEAKAVLVALGAKC